MRLGHALGHGRPGAAAVAACLAAAVLVPGSPAQAAEDVECSQLQTDDPVVQTDRASAPLELMGVPAAQELLRGLGQEPGAGVNVAVLDSGVAETPLVPVVRRRPERSDKDLAYYHGTAVAGIIAGRSRDPGGPMGVAPGAGIIDVRVYDTSETDPTEGGERPDADSLAAGLEWVARHAKTSHIKVANVSLAVRSSKRLAAAVRKAWDAGVVVVASSGNRPQGQGELNYPQLATLHPGEDAAKLVYPAGYPHVVAVNATAAGAGDVSVEESVLHNSTTDVAAPTYRAVSVAINGSTCLVSEIATSWAAAEISGVLALIRSRYPDDGPAEAVARLVGTASGSPATPTSLEGAGVVQPVEALTRPLPAGDPAGASRAGRRVARATAPEPEADVLAATRDHAVWWGLLGGGALLLAVLARPALARRREER